jgi:hypothetical protein
MEQEILKLSLELKSISVVLEGDNGADQKCTLKELTGKERNKYLTKMTGRIKTDPRTGKPTTLKTFDGFQADLLTRCFYNEEDILFTEDEIEALPSSTQQMLFDKAQELSGLNIDAKENEKND